MLTCSDCGAPRPQDRLVCHDCHTPYEDDTWLKLVAVTCALAGAIELVMWGTGARTWSVREFFMNETALMILGFVGLKLTQRLRDPTRPALHEALSVFSTRGWRVLLLSLPVVFLMFGSGLLPRIQPSVLASQDWRAVRSLINLPTPLLLIVGCVWLQGWAWLDLRVKNPLLPR